MICVLSRAMLFVSDWREYRHRLLQKKKERFAVKSFVMDECVSLFN
jgi:hypothetical protein